MDSKHFWWLCVAFYLIQFSQSQVDNSSADRNNEKVKKLNPEKERKRVKKLSLKTDVKSEDDQAINDLPYSTITPPESALHPDKSQVKKLTLKTDVKSDDEAINDLPSTTISQESALDPDLSSTEEKLLHNLLFNKKRIKKARPVKNWTDPVTVNIGMALIHLDLDEHKSIIEIDAWMRFNWMDEFLTWSPEDYDGVTQLHLKTWDLWRPDIHLYNNADADNMNHYGDVLYIVYNNGKVLWVPPAKLKAFCKVDLR